MPTFPDPSPAEGGSVCLSFHEGTLRLRGLRPRAVQRIFGEAGKSEEAGESEVGPEWVVDDRDDCFRTDAVHYPHVVARLRQDLSAEFRDEVPQWAAIDLALRRDARPALQLRSDQLQAVEAWLAGGRRGVIVMPTVTGKTVVAIEAEILERREAATPDGWRLERESEILHRGRQVFTPDFVLRQVDGDAPIYVELVGY